jgi:hypothetical protein
MTTKYHLGMSLGNGKITLSKGACGIGSFQKNGRFNMIMKTLEFKKMFEHAGEEQVCLKCLAKAKEQGRV